MRDNLSTWRGETPEQLPDIERAALATLDQAEVVHPLLRCWVEAIVSDSTYTTPFGEAITERHFGVSATWQSWAAADLAPDARPLTPDETMDRIVRSWGEGILRGYTGIANGSDYRSQTQYSERARAVLAYQEQAICRLGLGVVFFRRHGRPTSDTADPADQITLFPASDNLMAEVAYYATAMRKLATDVEIGGYDPLDLNSWINTR